MEWITGKALETVIGLNELRPGDQLRCAVCSEIHVIDAIYSRGSLQRIHAVDLDGLEVGGYLEPSDITAWRRP